MTPEEIALLQQQLYALQSENHAMRQELQRIAQQQQAASERRVQVLRGVGRLLIPLIDRQKVARSFGKLVETASGFAGARELWPTRDQVIVDARTFLESMVRFAIRRRTILLSFALLGAIVPAIQIWLVMQQNEIIDAQTKIVEEQRKHSEIQVFDVVARSMTEGDRNAKLMTGALLSRADPAFLAGVIDEAFDPELGGIYRADDLHASTRRLEDAAFRGYLVRAAVRGIHRRMATVPEEDIATAAAQAIPTLHQIIEDAKARVPEVLRLGKGGEARDGTLDEQVDAYLFQMGSTMRMHVRLARAQGQTAPMFDDLRQLFGRVEWSRLGESRFAEPLVSAMRALLEELAFEPGLRDGLNTEWAGRTPEEAYAKGLAVLREALGEDGIDWVAITQQVSP